MERAEKRAEEKCRERKRGENQEESNLDQQWHVPGCKSLLDLIPHVHFASPALRGHVCPIYFHWAKVVLFRDVMRWLK